MRDAHIALLPDRGVVSVTGEDAAKLLAGLLTNDIELLASRPAIFACLLSPQGKILFDFIVVRDGAGYLLDVARDKAADLAKRLTMYRLRARVDIEDVSGKLRVAVAWGLPWAGVNGVLAFGDPREPRLGDRLVFALSARTNLDRAIAQANGDWVWTEEVGYHSRRIGFGIPEGGKDYDFGDAFVHEANVDLLDGVSFDKGCYVGQEIVARMEHRGTVRKRVVRVTGGGALPADRPGVLMGDVVIGKLGSVAGSTGLALLRLDRAIEAIDKGQAITAGGVALTLDPAMLDRQRRLMAQKAADT